MTPPGDHHVAPAFHVRPIGEQPDGATPLADEDLAGLIPQFVATRGDLNEVELENIATAMPWATDQARLHGPAHVLGYGFLFELHRRMFGDVWRWAGTTRVRATNIGVDPALIVERTRATVDDAVFWHQNQVFATDERAARIHRRLVAVHPFPNGNGRCTRLVADLYLTAVGSRPFTWGAGDGQIDDVGTVRHTYLAALHAADGDDYDPLVTFCRS